MLLPQNMISRELAQLHVSVVSHTSFQEIKTPHEFLDERRYHSMIIQYSRIFIQEVTGCIQAFINTKIWDMCFTIIVGRSLAI